MTDENSDNSRNVLLSLPKTFDVKVYENKIINRWLFVVKFKSNPLVNQHVKMSLTNFLSEDSAKHCASLCRDVLEIRGVGFGLELWSKCRHLENEALFSLLEYCQQIKDPEFATRSSRKITCSLSNIDSIPNEDNKYSFYDLLLRANGFTLVTMSEGSKTQLGFAFDLRSYHSLSAEIITLFGGLLPPFSLKSDAVHFVAIESLLCRCPVGQVTGHRIQTSNIVKVNSNTLLQRQIPATRAINNMVYQLNSFVGHRHITFGQTEDLGVCLLIPFEIIEPRNTAKQLWLAVAVEGYVRVGRVTATFLDPETKCIFLWGGSELDRFTTISSEWIVGATDMSLLKDRLEVEAQDSSYLLEFTERAKKLQQQDRVAVTDQQKQQELNEIRARIKASQGRWYSEVPYTGDVDESTDLWFELNENTRRSNNAAWSDFQHNLRQQWLFHQEVKLFYKSDEEFRESWTIRATMCRSFMAPYWDPITLKLYFNDANHKQVYEKQRRVANDQSVLKVGSYGACLNKKK